MSAFDQLIMCKLNEISKTSLHSLNDHIKVTLDRIDKFAEECQNERGKKDQNQKKPLVNTLMSINEDEDVSFPKEVRKSNDGTEKRLSNKRNKEQVDGMSSPEQEKRPKRNASVKAQNNITKQVNVNLNQKLRRDDSDRSRRHKDHDKENAMPALQVKLEKISLPPEPMDTETALELEIKQEPNKDEATMPPPAAPVQKPRRLPPKEKSTDSEEEVSRIPRTRTRKNTDAMPPPAAAPAERAGRTGRSSRRATAAAAAAAAATATAAAAAPAATADTTTTADTATATASAATATAAAAQQAVEPPQPEPRPKRTRAKKKVSESSTTDSENKQPPSENGIGSPADKPRPKRTRRGKKAAEKEETSKPKETTPEPEIIIPKQEKISIPDAQSPAIAQKAVRMNRTNITVSSDESKMGSKRNVTKSKVEQAISLEETQVISQMNTTVTISVDKAVVLQYGVYDHTDGKNMIAMNETVVLDKINRDTMVLDKPQAKIMDCTVIIEKHATADMTEDLSLLTDDNSDPQDDNEKQLQKPNSAVKAKVQQFEEMAARTTRTKTRAMAKKAAETENNTPPDKMIPKQVLSADMLSKMNSMIFNGKTAQTSSSACKPVAKLPPAKPQPASASKVTVTSSRARDDQSRDRDDARRKKEALLEAKKELQKRKREEKMAAAAAAREAAERERRAALQAQARDRMEKQAHADQGKLERMKEAEKKKQELARKVAETEERRRAEEATRVARLADEQRKAEAARRRQQEEGEAMKKEAAQMAKEIEQRQKEYLEKEKKHKIKQRMEGDKMATPLKNGFKMPPMDPVHMMDGFEHLNSDDDEDKELPKIPSPAWYKSRHRQLALQDRLPPAAVDALFSVRVHNVDLRAIFPSVERAALKRTSSAVWRTPPTLHLTRVQDSPV